MSTAGQNTFKGINTQAKASLLLFLMNLKNSDLEMVILEDKNWEDFTLVFKSGKKIICESKDRKRVLSWAGVKSILSNIANKPNLTNQDEILIVCREVNKQLESNIEYLKYDFPETKKMYVNNGFTDELTTLLSKTRFFKIESDEYLYQEALTYFAEQITYWVPEDDLQMFMDSILIHKIYDKSQKGASFTKESLIQEIEDYKRRKIKDSYSYDPERKSLEDQIETQLNGVTDTTQRDRILNSNALTAITAQPNLGFFLLDYIKRLPDVHLYEFDELWKATLKRLYSFTTLLIFEKLINEEHNAIYILKFLTSNYDLLVSQVRETFNQEFAIELVIKIYDKYSHLYGDSFKFVQRVLSSRGSEYTSLDMRRDYGREKELIAELMLKLFIKFKEKREFSNTDALVELIYKHFDVVSDDSKHNLYSPNEVFEILKDYVELDYKNNLKKFIIEIVNQFKSREWYKNFNGWEIAGGGISQSGSDFSITDRHFVTLVLAPVIQNYYQVNKKDCWKYITENAARKITDVSRTNPDFLNRSMIPVIFAEYKDGEFSKEAFEILSDFIRTRKGIPWKADLIFQELRGNYSDEQKWRLIKISLDAYAALPVNVFVEQIVSQLASSSKSEKIRAEAISTIKNWAVNPEYAKRHITESFNLIDNISNLIKDPTETTTFNEGVNIFIGLVNSKDFVNKENSWRTWDVAKVLGTIITVSPERGIGVLKNITSKKTLKRNQQTLLCSSINDLPKDNINLLSQVYYEVISPMLDDLNNNISKIEATITDRLAREQIVQFAEKLALVGLLDESMRIVEIFVKDSDPIISNYPDDKKGDFNEHKKVIAGDDTFAIRTVRGWCAWVIQKLVIPRDFSKIDKTRSIISKLISGEDPILKQLINDDNYYVRLQAMIPLVELAKNRNTVLPENKKERFISFEDSNIIGELAFSALRNPINQKLPAVMKHLAMVFTYMRSIKQKDAWEVLQIFLKDEYPKKTTQRGRESYKADVMSEAAPLFIFFAEFRSKSFIDWPSDWGDLGVFDERPFKKLLRSLLESTDSEITRIFTWQFARLPEEVKQRPEYDEVFKMTCGYLMLATNNYDHSTFENIYRFIEDYIEDDRYFHLCYDLWAKCIQTEEKFFKENYSKDMLHDMYWWPFFYNGKILFKIAQQKGDKEFLLWFAKLANYPTDLLIANDLDVAVDHLVTLKEPKREIEQLFDRLMERNPKYYEYKQRWLEQSNN